MLVIGIIGGFYRLQQVGDSEDADDVAEAA
jgi:hypothetical protein